MSLASTPAQRPARGLAAEREWWRGAVVYQIYPRSFRDADGDGVGDLRGIVTKLPYVASLGVDAVWISPFCRSPMKDFGYDVSDYRAVDPLFGTLDDFDEVLRVAHALGLRVIMDLVISHTSDQHPWFVESRRDRASPKADWYVWADPKPDGTAPNNWLAVFGGSAWQWDSRRRQYYLHNFLASQPDLNFRNEEVQDALLDTARFWLDRGVDGFRLDTINFYFCDAELRDNPPLALERRNALIAPEVNPYNFQDHLHDKNQPENLAFLRRLRALMDRYPAAAALGEVGDAQYGMRLLGEYTAGDDLVQMCYAFEFLASEPLTAARVAAVLREYLEVAGEGWPCWAFSNHDVVRHASRWALSGAAQRLVAALLLSLRGSVCIYQGEELGLPQARIGYDDLRDPYGIEFWPDFQGRDGCRTPMVWSSEALHGGFSDVAPWLPVPSAHLPFSVDAQERDPDSLLAFYRQMVAFRAAHRALAVGSLEGVEARGDVVSFLRATGEETLCCAFNLGDGPGEAMLPDGDWDHLAAPGSGAGRPRAGRVVLGPWQSHFARRA